MAGMSTCANLAWSDLAQMKGQVATIAVVVACGVAVFVASLATYDSLKWRQQSYYASARFAQIYAQVKRAPNALVRQLRELPLVTEVEPPAQWSNVGDGYRVDARIVVFQQDDAVKVPTGALFHEGEQWAVFVFTDGHARKRHM